VNKNEKAKQNIDGSRNAMIEKLLEQQTFHYQKQVNDRIISIAKP